MQRLWILAFSAIVGCTGSGAKYPYHEEPDPRRSEYVIGVSDDIEISVWKNRELDARIAVRPDGHITMPLIGDVRAEGLTPSQLRDEIARRLTAYVREHEAVVTVAVTGVNSYYVTVAGNVTTPGRFTSKTYLTVADAIALAGGPNRFATTDAIFILRRSFDGTLKKIPIDYEEIIEGKRLEQNIVLMRGDRVFVP